jgi:hypothetical protein
VSLPGVRGGLTYPPRRGGRTSFSGQIRKSSGSVGATLVSALPDAIFPAGPPGSTSISRTADSCPTDSCCVRSYFDFCRPGFHPGGGGGEGPGDDRWTCCHDYSFFFVFAGNSGAAWRTGSAHTRGQSSHKPRFLEPRRLFGAPAAFRKPFSNRSRTQPAHSQGSTPGRNTMLAPRKRSGALLPSHPPFPPFHP